VNIQLILLKRSKSLHKELDSRFVRILTLHGCIRRLVEKIFAESLSSTLSATRKKSETRVGNVVAVQHIYWVSG
jgi:hypothetical protein